MHAYCIMLCVVLFRFVSFLFLFCDQVYFPPGVCLPIIHLLSVEEWRDQGFYVVYTKVHTDLLFSAGWLNTTLKG